jgi:hypothetical protein
MMSGWYVSHRIFFVVLMAASTTQSPFITEASACDPRAFQSRACDNPCFDTSVAGRMLLNGTVLCDSSLIIVSLRRYHDCSPMNAPAQVEHADEKGNSGKLPFYLFRGSPCT